MHRVFLDAGASNATWVWSVNHWSVPHTRANRIERYWPGRSFVDWVGISGFDSGPVRLPFLWQSFDTVFRSRYREVLRYGKPVIIAETGAPERGGNKAAWISAAFRSLLAGYPGISAIVWFDRRDTGQPNVGDWRIDSSLAALRAFRRAVADPRVLSAPSGVEPARRRL
jgi:beta-mannanase